MAGEVEMQQSGTRSLHLRSLRKQWQVITLQILATVALVWMYIEIVNTYVVGLIDHTIVLEMFDDFLKTESAGEFNLPLADWITGVGNDGLGRYYMPIAIGVVLGGSLALLSFQSSKNQQRIKLVFILGLILLLVGRLLFSWLFGMLFSWEWKLPTDNQWNMLVWPISLLASLMVLLFYLIPVIIGSRGIWGLSRKNVIWAMGFMLLFLAIQAILNLPIVSGYMGEYSDSIARLETQISEPTVGIFGYDMITPEQGSLILIAILLLIYQECAFGVIRYMEYAYRLPESCKKDPEYVTQVDNMLNGHLAHTVMFLGITGLATMISLGFHTVILEFVENISGNQWAAQVSESIELKLTYGLVISALLFLVFVGSLRFVIPWQRVSGLVESIFKKNKPINEDPPT